MVLANTLKHILPKFNSLKHPTFVEGQLIFDNVLAAIETIYHMKCKTREKIGEFTLKIDISKAFDKVEWNYFIALLFQ